MSTKEVAKVLGISRQTLYNWLRDGKIGEPPRHPLTHHMRWRAEDVARVERARMEAHAG